MTGFWDKAVYRAQAAALAAVTQKGNNIEMRAILLSPETEPGDEAILDTPDHNVSSIADNISRTEDNTLTPMYYIVYNGEGVVQQRGVIQRVEFDALLLDGYDVRETDAFYNEL